jgi:hypothetical protein
MGVIIQMKKTNEIIVFACDHHGVTNGLPMKDIIDQSKVRMLIPRPVIVPKSWLTTIFWGAAQHTQLNMLNPVHK